MSEAGQTRSPDGAQATSGAEPGEGAGRRGLSRISLCALKGVYHQWRKIPPREMSIGLVADERFGWVTGWIEAS